MATFQDVPMRNGKPHLIDDEVLALEFDHLKHDFQPTAHDVREMGLFGIEPTFKRRFKFVAMVGFASTVVMCWQNTLATFSFALQNGGTGGYFFTYIYGMIAFGFTYLSLAELSSSCAPHKFRIPISYCVGWLCSLAWLGYLAGCGVIIGNLIHDAVLIYHPESSAANSQWFPTIFALVALIIGGLFNGQLSRQFPALEGIMVVIHVVSWVAFIVVLWTTSPIGDAEDVLLTFNNGGGWVNDGGATLIGVLTACTENAKDASFTIPWSLMISYAVNAAMGFIAGVTVIFCAGDLDEVLSNGTQAPFVTIFYNSTQSKVGTVLMLLPFILCFLSSQISETATACRQIWAFARDDGLPWSHKLKDVPDAETPQTALWTVIAATFVITCVNFGSAVGFNAIISLVSLSLTCSYVITISCVIWHRVRGSGLPKERFSLGRAGLIINILALCTMAPIMVLAPFPPSAQVTPATMNWAILIFGVVIIFSILYYILVGRKRFRPTLRKGE
ncbi:hypothetical protein LTR78_004595 [Recurvomyces mirabilis]|uniref:Uncharacterized protein n=1 Tax=Recurvomyces mirabilis TaxID=574656 RepID=A0AAE0WPG2_9PEZI|nr:hypothetical protein LTR78_004595 [Recurvomyces mirabilis]KAK5152911.1 hypothetical protein LTS14_008019 [Recurvomyces mirabilis]